MASMWLSSGGTKSVVHYDVGDNMNCLLSGRKRMALWSSDLRDKIEAHGMGWVNHELDPKKHQTCASPFDFRSAVVSPFDFISAMVSCPTHGHFYVTLWCPYGSRRYGRYAGGAGVDEQSINTDSVDLARYPGWVSFCAPIPCQG